MMLFTFYVGLQLQFIPMTSFISCEGNLASLVVARVLELVQPNKEEVGCYSPGSQVDGSGSPHP